MGREKGPAEPGKPDATSGPQTWLAGKSEFRLYQLLLGKWTLEVGQPGQPGQSSLAHMLVQPQGCVVGKCSDAACPVAR